MEYIYSAMVLYAAGKDITEDAIAAILKAAGVEPDAAKIKALTASLEGVDIADAIASASVMAAAPAAAGAAPAAAADAPAAAAEEPEEEAVSEESGLHPVLEEPVGYPHNPGCWIFSSGRGRVTDMLLEGNPSTVLLKAYCIVNSQRFLIDAGTTPKGIWDCFEDTSSAECSIKQTCECTVVGGCIYKAHYT